MNMTDYVPPAHMDVVIYFLVYEENFSTGIMRGLNSCLPKRTSTCIAQSLSSVKS